MQPRIIMSELTRPPRWYVATRYTFKHDIDAKTGDKHSYIVASKKYDVTDQMETIISNLEACHECGKVKPKLTESSLLGNVCDECIARLGPRISAN